MARGEATCWEVDRGEVAHLEVVGRTGRCWQMVRGNAMHLRGRTTHWKVLAGSQRQYNAV